MLNNISEYMFMHQNITWLCISDENKIFSNKTIWF